MVALTADPRSVTEADFPAAGTPAEQWLFLLNYGLLAPSEYNTQPWLFRVQGDSIELSLDTSRRLPVVDPDDREALISCGAVCLNLRLAAHHFGYRTRMESFVLHKQPEFLVRLSLDTKQVASEADERLFAAIPRRHTNRSVYEERGVPEELLEQLKQDAGHEGTWLLSIQDEPTRQAVTHLVITGDREQWADREFRRELAEWVQPRSPRNVDGLPGLVQAKGSIRAMTSPFVVRTFDLWREEAARDRHLLSAGAPVLLILGTFTDTPDDWFAAGMALERVLLDACAAGLQTSFVNQPTEVPALRTWLGQILKHDSFPQLIIRIGYGQPAPFTPRRCVQDVLLTTP